MKSSATRQNALSTQTPVLQALFHVTRLPVLLFTGLDPLSSVQLDILWITNKIPTGNYPRVSQLAHLGLFCEGRGLGREEYRITSAANGSAIQLPELYIFGQQNRTQPQLYIPVNWCGKPERDVSTVSVSSNVAEIDYQPVRASGHYFVANNCHLAGGRLPFLELAIHLCTADCTLALTAQAKDSTTVFGRTYLVAVHAHTILAQFLNLTGQWAGMIIQYQDLNGCVPRP
mmetsp:Transcript_26854/g.65179  ORF Transcript_26854/g.65179 Transcript_26854/m.65179 type:complete len:230 (+) Transcript_26854:1488-2177(+)